MHATEYYLTMHSELLDEKLKPKVRKLSEVHVHAIVPSVILKDLCMLICFLIIHSMFCRLIPKASFSQLLV